MASNDKSLNILGAIGASVLSIILVISLIVTPIFFSALSLFAPKNLANTITKAAFSDTTSTGNGNAMADGNAMATEGVVSGDATASGGSYEENSQMSKVSALLSTKAVKEILEIYATDITDVLSGKTDTATLDTEKIIQIVTANKEELIAVMKTVQPELAELSEEEVESEFKNTFIDNADVLLRMLPSVQEIKAEVVDSNPAIAKAFTVVAKATTIKTVIIIAIILISAAIFACRLYDLKGFKWIAIDLFVASGLLLLVSVGIIIAAPIISASAGGLAGPFVSAFSNGIVIRLLVMIVVGIVLLVASKYIRRAVIKRAVAAAATINTLPSEAEENNEE